MKISASKPVSVCPLCGGTRQAAFGQVEQYGVVWHYRICRYCGFVFQSPQMTDVEREAFYRHHYWALHGQGATPDATEIAFQHRRAENLLALVPEDQSVGRFLDIGCSAGAALEVARRRFDAKVIGIEAHEDFQAFLHAQGLRVYASVDGFLAAGTEPVDMVCLSHVLEHLPDPVAYLEQMRTKVLDSKGHLLVEVPNVYAHGSFEAAHVCCFSVHTLTDTFRQAGFEVVRIVLHNVPRESKKRPLYLAMLGRVVGAPTRRPVRRAVPGLERWRRRYGLTEGSLLHRVYRTARAFAGEVRHRLNG